MDAKQEHVKDFEFKLYRILADLKMLKTHNKVDFDHLSDLMAILDKASEDLNDAINIASCEE